MFKHVWFIDDDEDTREQWHELFDGCQTFENAFDAVTLGRGQPEVIVVDLSACGSIHMTHAAYSPICNLLERYPGAECYVMSALPVGYAQDVASDVLREKPEACIKALAFDADLESILAR